MSSKLKLEVGGMQIYSEFGAMPVAITALKLCVIKTKCLWTKWSFSQFRSHICVTVCVFMHVTVLYVFHMPDPYMEKGWYMRLCM